MPIATQPLTPKFYVYSRLEFWPGPVKIAECNSRAEAQAVVDIETRKLHKEGKYHDNPWITTEKAPAATRA